MAPIHILKERNSSNMNIFTLFNGWIRGVTIALPFAALAQSDTALMSFPQNINQTLYDIYDFDLDGVNDKITLTGDNAASMSYTLSIVLSSTNRTFSFPEYPLSIGDALDNRIYECDYLFANLYPCLLIQDLNNDGKIDIYLRTATLRNNLFFRHDRREVRRILLTFKKGRFRKVHFKCKSGS